MQNSQNIKTDNKSFERLEQFRYLGTTLTNKIILGKKIRAVAVRECLISFGANVCLFQSVVQKYKD
jgi:hypothetical protein